MINKFKHYRSLNNPVISCPQKTTGPRLVRFSLKTINSNYEFFLWENQQICPVEVQKRKRKTTVCNAQFLLCLCVNKHRTILCIQPSNMHFSLCNTHCQEYSPRHWTVFHNIGSVGPSRTACILLLTNAPAFVQPVPQKRTFKLFLPCKCDKYSSRGHNYKEIFAHTCDYSFKKYF